MASWLHRVYDDADMLSYVYKLTVIIWDCRRDCPLGDELVPTEPTSRLFFEPFGRPEPLF